MLGLRHATEADHVVAVSTIVSQGRSLLAAAAVGVYWGIGHTLALLAAGMVVLLAGLAVPEAVTSRLELLVAAMIVLLGANLLRNGGTSRQAGPAPARGALAASKPVVVGMVHGLAGSAALMVLIQTEIARDASAALGFGYLLLFGAGSIAGMLLMGLLIGLPFALGGRMVAPVSVWLQRLAGAGSVLFGLWYGWQAWAGG